MSRGFAAGAVVVLGACAGPTSASPPAAPDAIHLGPQGNVGQFVVQCAPSHAGFDDPILYPGQPGASHLHQFFGNPDIDAMSTSEDADRSTTSCDQRLDTASYWAPALFDASGDVVEPIDVVAYYRAAVGVDPATVVPYPQGLKMVAGDHRAAEPQPTTLVGWSCAPGRARSEAAPVCTPRQVLHMWVTFPDCWDGERIESDDHRAHVGYSDEGACLPSHPVSIPQLDLAVRYPPVPAHEVAELLLASGDLTTVHADFWNLWDEAKLRREVDVCIRGDVVCTLGPG